MNKIALKLRKRYNQYVADSKYVLSFHILGVTWSNIAITNVFKGLACSLYYSF